MRNKIKQLLKKEEGFTLIELLAVIAILALIVAISIPLIGNVIADSKTKTDEAQEALIIDAAQMYYIQNPDETTTTVEDLVNGGYLEDNVNTETTTVDKADVMKALEKSETDN